MSDRRASSDSDSPAFSRSARRLAASTRPLRSRTTTAPPPPPAPRGRTVSGRRAPPASAPLCRAFTGMYTGPAVRGGRAASLGGATGIVRPAGRGGPGPVRDRGSDSAPPAGSRRERPRDGRWGLRRASRPRARLARRPRRGAHLPGPAPSKTARHPPPVPAGAPHGGRRDAEPRLAALCRTRDRGREKRRRRARQRRNAVSDRARSPAENGPAIRVACRPGPRGAGVRAGLRRRSRTGARFGTGRRVGIPRPGGALGRPPGTSSPERNGAPMNSTGSDPLHYTDAVELARMLRGREVSAREVVQAHLDRIHTVDPLVNAVVTRC